jgi:hypothetical protein
MTRKKISFSEAIKLLPVLVMLGPLIFLFWEFPRWPATKEGWLYILAGPIPIFIALLAWEVLVGTDDNAKQKSCFGFKVSRILGILFWLGIAIVYFFVFELLFPDLRDRHLVPLF